MDAGGDGNRIGDWRSGLTKESRTKIVHRIAETLLRHTHVVHQEWMSELFNLAIRFEQRIFAAAADRQDYLRKISSKMHAVESRAQPPAGGGMAGGIAQGGDPGPMGLLRNQTQTSAGGAQVAQHALATTSVPSLAQSAPLARALQFIQHQQQAQQRHVEQLHQQVLLPQQLLQQQPQPQQRQRQRQLQGQRQQHHQKVPLLQQQPQPQPVLLPHLAQVVEFHTAFQSFLQQGLYKLPKGKQQQEQPQLQQSQQPIDTLQSQSVQQQSQHPHQMLPAATSQPQQRIQQSVGHQLSFEHSRVLEQLQVLKANQRRQQQQQQRQQHYQNVPLLQQQQQPQLVLHQFPQVPQLHYAFERILPGKQQHQQPHLQQQEQPQQPYILSNKCDIY